MLLDPSTRLPDPCTLPEADQDAIVLIDELRSMEQKLSTLYAQQFGYGSRVDTAVDFAHAKLSAAEDLICEARLLVSGALSRAGIVQ